MLSVALRSEQIDPIAFGVAPGSRSCLNEANASDTYNQPHQNRQAKWVFEVHRDGRLCVSVSSDEVDVDPVFVRTMGIGG